MKSNQYYTEPNPRYGSMEFDILMVEKRLSSGQILEARELCESIFKKNNLFFPFKKGQISKVSLYKIIHIYPDYFKLSFLSRIKIITIRLAVRKHKYKFNKKEGNLALIDKLKPEELSRIKRELLVNECLWTINTGRADFTGSPHLKTNAIEIVSRNQHERTSYINSAGKIKRYGEYTPESELYPNLKAFVSNFEQNMGGKLGRVCLVRLKPKQCVYGHFDGEWKLRGFDRYHVVLDSTEGSYMHVADQQAVFNNGEIFFFENKKWHTAYNQSQKWRTHLILDIRMPKEKSRSLPVYNYSEWNQWSHVRSHDS